MGITVWFALTPHTANVTRTAIARQYKESPPGRLLRDGNNM
jgi:hypothetical protein